MMGNVHRNPSLNVIVPKLGRQTTHTALRFGSLACSRFLFNTDGHRNYQLQENNGEQTTPKSSLGDHIEKHYRPESQGQRCSAVLGSEILFRDLHIAGEQK